MENNRRVVYKHRIVQVMGGKCQCCGYNNYEGALELHHLNEEEKSFTISSKTYFSWDKLENELKKCVLLCANCHREVHAGLKHIEKSSFNQEIYDNIQAQINDIKEKHDKVCPNCGKIITNKAFLCRDCFDKKRQKCERPSREELKFLIRTIPFVHITEQYNVTDNSIRKWCDKYNLPRKVSEIKSYSDEEWDKI